MKSLRSPIAIAAAALMAAPPVVYAQPVSLTPPPREEPAPAAAPTEAPPAGAPIAVAPIPPAAEGEPAELRGPVGPLPTDLSLASLPPSPPTLPPPPPAAAAPTVAPVVAPAATPRRPPPPRMASIPSATVSVGAQDDYTRLLVPLSGRDDCDAALARQSPRSAFFARSRYRHLRAAFDAAASRARSAPGQRRGRAGASGADA